METEDLVHAAKVFETHIPKGACFVVIVREENAEHHEVMAISKHGAGCAVELMVKTIQQFQQNGFKTKFFPTDYPKKKE